MGTVAPFTLFAHDAIVHPGLLVKPADQAGALFERATWFIHWFHVTVCVCAQSEPLYENVLTA